MLEADRARDMNYSPLRQSASSKLKRGGSAFGMSSKQIAVYQPEQEYTTVRKSTVKEVVKEWTEGTPFNYSKG